MPTLPTLCITEKVGSFCAFLSLFKSFLFHHQMSQVVDPESLLQQNQKQYHYILKIFKFWKPVFFFSFDLMHTY